MKAVPRLHVVTDDAILARGGWASAAIDVMEAGGDRVSLHVRGPRTGGSRLFALCSALLPAARGTGATLAVNDRVDVALALDMRSVHLGRRSLDPVSARALLGSTATLGVSAHSVEEVREAAATGVVDYAFLGNLFPTPSHPEREGHGLSELTAAVREAGPVPVIGIGGISIERAPDILAAGAHGVAVVRGVWEAERPADAVSEYISMLSGAATKPNAG